LNRVRHIASCIGLITLVGIVGSAQRDTLSRVTEQDLLTGRKNPAAWLMFAGDYSGQRHSQAKQLTPGNVSGLQRQWTFQTDVPGFPGRGIETTPLLSDGRLYLTANGNQVWALEARSGRPIWNYKRALPEGFSASVCCGPVNRGLAILGDRLFMGTLDSHLVALDRSNGNVVWDVGVGDLKNANTITMAPLVIGGKVIVGVAGSDFATRGYIDAYDAKSGARLWRFYTIPLHGEPGGGSWPNDEVAMRGGGGLWVTGSYDPATKLVYFGTGNPNPRYYGLDREGDNLYTCSLVALDVDTGTLRWFYQFTPHDLHDWDSAHVPVLADLQIAGRLRKVVMVANRNSFFFTLDRETGELIVGKPFTDNTNWAAALGPGGHPVVLDEVGTAERCLQDQHGGTGFPPPSYDPQLRLFFVTAHETCAVYQSNKPAQPIVIGRRVPDGGPRRVDGREQFAALRAIDPTTGERKWEHRYRNYPSSVSLDLTGGIMTTATGLLFTGDNDGTFYAFESASGKQLWKADVGAPVWGTAPISYMLDGRQWVVTPAGLTITAFALPSNSHPQ
jgi:alcohol dehydrogenase (cytochrome c)